MKNETDLFKITGSSLDGSLLAVRVKDGKKARPLPVMNNSKIKPALSEGDEFIGSVSSHKKNRAIKPLSRLKQADNNEDTIVGVIELRQGNAYLKSPEKNDFKEYLIENPRGVKNGDFVKVALSGERRFKRANVIKNYGTFNLNKATGELILRKYDIPDVFNEKIARELKYLPQYNETERLDLTKVPLVTIDGEDSKDFDDAIWAEKTPLGFNLIVAIADVAFYVRDGNELDREAFKRGNSVYLPNMVVPMLPEKLCNDLCSLNPQQKRPVIAGLMQIDNDGNLLNFEFKRAVMKSAARLTYTEVQAALDGHKSANIAPVWATTVRPAYEAYLALYKARKRRGTLNLTVTEYQIKLDKDGVVTAIIPEAETTANKLIEEFMIAANVAAAKTLEKSKLPIMFRVHDHPQAEKLAEIKPLLSELKMKLPDAPALKPTHLNKLIAACEKIDSAQGISQMILRLQSQAQYSPQNIGHFGLGLKDYVHFTSPIRRYADLLIHRALIAALKLPDGGGLTEVTPNQFAETAKHLCETERKAVNAERDLTARFVAAYLRPAVGQEFEVRITGVTNAGIFAAIESLGAEGLIPLSTLPDDDYILSEGNRSLEGVHSGETFKLGQVIKAKLREATPVTGGLIFKYLDAECGDNYFEKKNRGYRPAAAGKSKTKSGADKKEVKAKIKKQNKQRKKSLNAKRKRTKNA